MSLLVKICGVSTPEAADAAAAAGADAIGFVFHAPSRRHVDPRRAAALAARLPRGILRVAVTLHPGPQDVRRVLDAFEPDAWQSDAGDFASMDLPPGIARWPVYRRAGDQAHALPARLVFDAPQSGLGLRADWQCAAELARRREVVLAGGLDAANVGSALAAVRPFGVDVSSGVEGVAGAKDPARIRDFVAAARATAGGLWA